LVAIKMPLYLSIIGQNSHNNADEAASLRSLYDPDPVDEADLWFLPGLPEDNAPTDLPWAVAARETVQDADSWRSAEAAQYRTLVTATQKVGQFAERARQFSSEGLNRIALSSVAAVLHSEGEWLSAEQIALYLQLRIAGEAQARDLSRADWALRRLARPVVPQDGLHRFLGRTRQDYPSDITGAQPRATGTELDKLGARWSEALGAVADFHPITQAGFALAEWQRLDISPPEDVLEPTIAAMVIGAGDLAPFLPVAHGAWLGRSGNPEQRLAGFYQAVSAGAASALLTLDRLANWQDHATRITRDLSGRVPGQLIAALMRLPVVSAELVADSAGCSRVAARRNLALFEDRGLIRETTGQSRYRYWTVRL
jgi:hypothetical protein